MSLVAWFPAGFKFSKGKKVVANAELQNSGDEPECSKSPNSRFRDITSLIVDLSPEESTKFMAILYYQ